MNGQVPENGLNLENKFSIAIDEFLKTSPKWLKGKLKIVPDHEEDDDEEFHDVDDGGFIDDSYCWRCREFKDQLHLPSIDEPWTSQTLGQFEDT